MASYEIEGTDLLILLSCYVLWMLTFAPQHGASLETQDREGLTPLGLVMKDRLPLTQVQFTETGM